MRQPAPRRRTARAVHLPLVTALAVTAGAASAQSTLYSNGTYINSPTGGPGGEALSIVRSSFGYTTLGFQNVTTVGTRAADDFVVPAGQTWSLQTLRVFEFCTNSGPVSPFTAINVRIWNARPGDAGASVIAGSTSTNLLVQTLNVACFRIPEVNPEFTRPIFSVDAGFSPPLALPAGHYWVDWQLASNGAGLAHSVTVCPTTSLPLPGANARSYTGSAWINSVDGANLFAVEFPFLLIGSGGGPGPCYPNCDASTTPPVLNVLDFNCFLNAFSAGNTYANCDGSTTPPALNVLDFNCFLNRFSAGCP
jgi:hypothetical protein